MADLTGPQIQEGQKAWDSFDDAQTMRQYDPEDYDELKTNWAWRRPTIFDPEKNMIYIGQPGTHHHNVAEEFGLGAYSDEPEGKRYDHDKLPSGWVTHSEMPPGIASWHNQYGNGPVGFYWGETPEAMAALYHHLGLKPEPQTQWEFKPADLPMDPDPIDQSGNQDFHPGIQSKRSRWDRY
jgi:hypothetical protein